MIAVRLVGHFRELECGVVDGPSIHDARDSLDQPTADAVSFYLESGIAVFDVMEAVRDPLDAREYIPGGASLLSDGKWVWRADLVYFVRKYRVALPPEFTFQARELGVVKAVPDDVLGQLDEILAVAGWK